MKANKCQICGRQLTSEQSIALGVGPECAEKRAGFVASCGTTDDELATLAAVGGDCNRLLKYFYIEMRSNNQRLAQCWIESARRTAERDAIGKQQAADHYGKRWDMAAEYKQDKEAA